jgi:hypothetical protein
MRYDDGNEILSGDEVDLDGEAAIVETVLETPDALEAYGLPTDRPGVLFECQRMGGVFEPRDGISWNAILLLRRWFPRER